MVDMPLNQTKPNQTKSNQIKSNQNKPNQTKSNQIKQRVPRLSRSLSSNFWLVRNTNDVKFTDEFVSYTEKHILVGCSLMSLTWLCQYEPDLKNSPRSGNTLTRCKRKTIRHSSQKRS